MFFINLFIIMLSLFFNVKTRADNFPLVSVDKKTRVSGLLALSYFSYKYGGKSVAKKLPFILPSLGVFAALQNENKRCVVFSSGFLGGSVLAHLLCTHRNFLMSVKAVPLYCVVSGVVVGKRKKNKKIIFASLGALAIYSAYSYRHILFTKKKLFQFFCCALLVAISYKIFSNYRIVPMLENRIVHMLENRILRMLETKFSSLFFSLVIHDAMKNFLQKNNFFNKMPCFLLFSVMVYTRILVFIEFINDLSSSWNSIKRPDWFDEAVSLKVKDTKCFYNLAEGKDYTATLCGTLEANRVFDLDQVDYKTQKYVIGIIIKTFSEENGESYEDAYKIKINEDMLNKLKPSIKTIFETQEELALEENWYWDDYEVKFSKKRFTDIVKLYFTNLSLEGDIDSEDFSQKICQSNDDIEGQIKAWAKKKDLIQGRVFDREIDFDKILLLIRYMHTEKLFNIFTYIFSKDIDMRWKKVLRKGELNDNDLKYIAIHCLYGIFCDTCNLSFKSNLNNFQAVKTWCFGCKYHTNKGFIYGPMTVLEHMILTVRKKISNEEDNMKDLAGKLIDLGIVERSFFALIKV